MPQALQRRPGQIVQSDLGEDPEDVDLECEVKAGAGRSRSQSRAVAKVTVLSQAVLQFDDKEYIPNPVPIEIVQREIVQAVGTCRGGLGTSATGFGQERDTPVATEIEATNLPDLIQVERGMHFR